MNECAKQEGGFEQGFTSSEIKIDNFGKLSCCSAASQDIFGGLS